MKWMIASDLHGSAYYCAAMLRALEREEADRLLLLGDILYHGPRNDLPREYAPKQVTAMLSGVKERLLCVRGNCDSEVDQMVLPFPMMAEYAVMPFGAQGEHIIYATHGHIYNADNPPPLMQGDILLHGHTHVPLCRDCGSFTCLNPGSVSLPKEESCHSYMTLEAGHFYWKELESGEVYLPND